MSLVAKNSRPITTDSLLQEILQGRLDRRTVVALGVNADGTIVTVEEVPTRKGRRLVPGKLHAYTVTDLPQTAGQGTIDVSDRAGRLLGIIASITAAVDVSDRAGRLAGITGSQDVSGLLIGRIGFTDDFADVVNWTVTGTGTTLTTDGDVATFSCGANTTSTFTRSVPGTLGTNTYGLLNIRGKNTNSGLDSVTITYTDTTTQTFSTGNDLGSYKVLTYSRLTLGKTISSIKFSKVSVAATSCNIDFLQFYKEPLT